MDDLREKIKQLRIFKFAQSANTLNTETFNRFRENWVDDIEALIDSYSREARIDEAKQLKYIINGRVALSVNTNAPLHPSTIIDEINRHIKTLKEGKAPRQFLTGAEKRLWEQAEVDDDN